MFNGLYVAFFANMGERALVSIITRNENSQPRNQNLFRFVICRQILSGGVMSGISGGTFQFIHDGVDKSRGNQAANDKKCP